MHPSPPVSVLSRNVASRDRAREGDFGSRGPGQHQLLSGEELMIIIISIRICDLPGQHQLLSGEELILIIISIRICDLPGQHQLLSGEELSRGFRAIPV